MTKTIWILSTILTASFLSQAQVDSADEQLFYKEFDNRGFDGNYNSYVVRLHSDFTIEIQVYSMPGMLYNPPFHKATYHGKYRRSNDTCYISYVMAYTEVKDKNRTVERYAIPADIPFLISNSVFFIRNGVVSSPGLLFPALPRAHFSEVQGLEMKFR